MTQPLDLERILICHPEPLTLMGASDERVEGSCDEVTFDVSVEGTPFVFF